MKRSTLFALVLTLVTLSPLTPVMAEDRVLENESTRLVLRGNRIVSLFDKVRAIEHVSPQADANKGMFHLQLVKDGQPASDVDATAMTSRVVQSSASRLELEFTHEEAMVRLQVDLSPVKGELAWSIAATPSDQGHAVGSVACPVFQTPVSAEGAVKDCLLPLYEGRLHPLNVKMIDHKPKAYPAMLFAQMTACLGPKGGFLLWCDDTTGQVKEFSYRTVESLATFAIIHRMPYVPGEWRCSYRSRLSFAGPTWQETADIYRSWAAGQPWCATKLKDRKDVPAFLHAPHFHSTVQLGKEQNLAAIPAELAALGRRLETPVIVRGTYWEKRGGWVGIDYFPPSIGDEGLRSFAKNLEAQNIKLICEIAGYRWLNGKEKSVVINQINKLTPNQKDALGVFFDENNGAAVCEMGRDGKLNPSTTLCRGSNFGKKFLQDMAKRLFDLGLKSFDCDSDIGPSPDGVSGCFNPAHGHPIPCGSWATENTRNAFREIKVEAARRGIDDFLLVKEHCTELLNMEVHAYLSRLSLTYKEPHVVPLTQYLYHEYLPVVLYNTFPAELNDIIIFGQIPGGSALLERQPVLMDYYQSMKSHAKPFLLYGQMLRPLIPDTDIPTNITTFTDQKSGAKSDLQSPIVRQSAWRDDAGNIAVFAINTTDKEMIVHVPTPAAGAWQATVHLGPARERTEALPSGGQLRWALAPGRLASIVFKPNP